MREKAKFIVFTVTLLLITGSYFQSGAFAQEKVRVEDRLIGSTFKTLAKVFLAMVDINKLKEDNIDKLNKMDKEKFQRRYAKVYEVIKDLPPKLKVSYGITEHTTKEKVIENIESFDKKKIYETIDSIPDTLIAKQFKQ